MKPTSQSATLRRAGAGLAVVLVLAACGGAEAPVADNLTANAQPAAPATPAETAQPVLTSEGWGPLRIGMTRAEVVAALGEDRNPEAVGGPDPESCDQFFPARAPEGLLVMIESGRLTRIDLIPPATLATDRGLRLGATAAALRTAYGNALRAEPHKYEAAPAFYLTAWTGNAPPTAGEATPPNARGLRYELGAEGTVQRIIAGGPSIEYVEGCA